jgi:hypothetical protein
LKVGLREILVESQKNDVRAWFARNHTFFGSAIMATMAIVIVSLTSIISLGKKNNLIRLKEMEATKVAHPVIELSALPVVVFLVSMTRAFARARTIPSMDVVPRIFSSVPFALIGHVVGGCKW